MEYGKNLINQWPMLQETAGIASSWAAVSVMAEMEPGRDSRKGKMMWLTAKYWKPAMHMDIQYLVRHC